MSQDNKYTNLKNQILRDQRKEYKIINECIYFKIGLRMAHVKIFKMRENHAL